MTQPTYDPSVFSVRNIDEAKRIILTPEGGSTTERWQLETPFIAGLARDHLQLSPIDRLLDHGCGIGRISKAIMTDVHCFALGVDISPSMRALAHAHVGSDRFAAMSPAMFNVLQPAVNAAVSIWVLQHVAYLDVELDLIYSALVPGGRFLLVNNEHRALPVKGGGWQNDGLDVRRAVTNKFKKVVASGKLPIEICPPGLSELTFWEVYEK